MIKKEEENKNVTEGGRSSGGGAGDSSNTSVTEKTEKVEVDKKILEQVLDKQKDQDKIIKRLTDDNKRLTSVADKSRLAWYDEQHSEGGLIHTFRVGVYKDYDDIDEKGNVKTKIILGWKMIKDEVRFENNVLKENQVIRLFLDDGEGKDPKEKDVTIYEFTREIDRLTGELVSESKNAKGLTKTLRFPDGREIEFDVLFLNP